LTQLDLEVIANLPATQDKAISQIEDGLFLVGDGAQTIYKRGFSLKSIGIQVTGRSYYLKKNYRNSFEILQAAFALVRAYKFADVDEDNIAQPEEPDFPMNHGMRPIIVKCKHTTEEADFIARKIWSLLAAGQTPGQICVVGCNQLVRDEVQRALDALGFKCAELKQDVKVESERIKLSTIESAKGHEFSVVFIAGLVDGVIPLKTTSDNELSREAARLYVAMTRARDELFLSYSPSPEFRASRFLTQISDYCDEVTCSLD
jgi:superfamily I DNA/RNA helicase